MTLPDILRNVLALLTPTGREVAVRRRRADAEAALAAERIEAARLLTGIASVQLRHFELDCALGRTGPELADCDVRMRDALNDIMRDEVYRFWRRTEEPW